MKMMLPKLDARIHPYDDKSGRATKLLAFADLTIAESFVIKGIKVLQREDKDNDEPFVVFPSEKGKGQADDRWFDIAHPVTAEARTASIAIVLEKYQEQIRTPKKSLES